MFQGRAAVYKLNATSNEFVHVDSIEVTDTAGQDSTVSNRSGEAVAISADSTTIVVGEPRWDLNENNTKFGRVHVYARDDTTMLYSSSELGINHTLYATDTANNYLGRAVASNANGSVVAVGAPGYNSGLGVSLVYELNEYGVYEIVTVIEGTSTSHNFGRSVWLSSDGLTMAVGAYKNNNLGYVRLYVRNGTDYEMKVEIDHPNDEGFGRSVVITPSASHIAVGDPNFNTSRGLAAVYSFDGESVTQIGSDLKSDVENSNFGRSVALTSNAKYLIVGAAGDDLSTNGTVHVFRFDAYASDWVEVLDQKTGDLSGDDFGDWFGASLAVTPNRHTLVVGATQNAYATSTERIGYAKMLTCSCYENERVLDASCVPCPADATHASGMHSAMSYVINSRRNKC